MLRRRQVDPSEYSKPLHGPNQFPDEALVPGYKQVCCPPLAFVRGVCISDTHRQGTSCCTSMRLMCASSFRQPGWRVMHQGLVDNRKVNACPAAPPAGRHALQTDRQMLLLERAQEVPACPVLLTKATADDASYAACLASMLRLIRLLRQWQPWLFWHKSGVPIQVRLPLPQT